MFDRFQSLRNNSQQHATSRNRVCKRTQHVTSNNVASILTGLNLSSAPILLELFNLKRKEREGEVGSHFFIFITLSVLNLFNFLCRCNRLTVFHYLIWYNLVSHGWYNNITNIFFLCSHSTWFCISAWGSPISFIIISGSFPFNLLLLLRQVVKYDVHGHYHCHHDSDEVDPSLPCCTFSTEENCRLCRSVDLYAMLLDGVDSLNEGQNEFRKIASLNFT